MKIKYNARKSIGIIITLIAVSITFGFLHIRELFGLLAVEVIFISLLFVSKLFRKITLVQGLWVISTIYMVLNTKTFNNYVFYYLLCAVAGLMILICIESNACEYFYRNFRFFAYFGLFSALTIIFEVINPSFITNLYRALSPGDVTTILMYLRNGRFLGITNYVWYTSILLFIGGGYIISDFENADKKRKVFYSFSVIAMVFATFLAGSRSSILLFPLIMIIFYGGRKNIRNVLIAFFFMAILYYIVMYSGLSFRIIQTLRTLLGRILAGDILDARRAGLRELAISLFSDHKFFGIGFYEFRYYAYRMTTKYYHVHNLYYQLLAENGIVGTFIIILPWVITFFRTGSFLYSNRLNRTDLNYKIAKYCFMLQAYFYIASFAHVTIFDGQTMLLFYIICGISLKCVSQKTTFLSPNGQGLFK